MRTLVDVSRGPYFGGLDPKYVRERVLEAHKLGSLCGAAIFDLGPINKDSRTKYGLPSGHAYTLTGSSEDQVEVSTLSFPTIKPFLQTSQYRYLSFSFLQILNFIHS